MSLFRKSENRDGWGALHSFATGGGPLLGSGTKAALTLVPVYAATSLIADQFSILPMTVYEHSNGRRKKIQPQPDLVLRPHQNPTFTRIEWLHQFATSFLLRGNAYGLVTSLDNRGVPSKIAWLDPDAVRVDESGTMPVYWYGSNQLDTSTLLHIPWYPRPGSVVGLSPISQFKTMMEAGAAAVDYANKWFRNGATPSGHLKYAAGTLNPEQTDAAKKRFKAAVSGNDFFVSGNDWDWKALSVTAEEAQFLEARKTTANEVAAIYKVSPEDIGGEAGSSMTYATVELNQIKFQVRALQPIFTRLETHLSLRFLPEFQYIKFNADALIRTDSLTRAKVHEINLRTAMETQDEGRALEDKSPLTPEQNEDWLLHYRHPYGQTSLQGDDKQKPTKEEKGGA